MAVLQIRQKATKQLETDRLALEDNFSELEKVNKEQLDVLQADSESIQAEVVELESSFPELGAPFDVFNRGLELAQASELDLLSISSVNTEIKKRAPVFCCLKNMIWNYSGHWRVVSHLLKKLKQPDWIP